MTIDGETKLLCLIGSPVGHSKSPAMYNYCFDRMHLNYAYMAFEVKKEDTRKAFDALKLLQVRGLNITMPCKTEACACCDALSKAAELIGAVNTVVNEDGKWIGHNTDGIGWVRSMQAEGIDIRKKKMTIAGAGGAATAIAITAALEGLRELSIFARKNGHTYANAEKTAEKIRTHVRDCRVGVYDLEDRDLFYQEIADSDIFTNGTNVGMSPKDGESLIEDMSVFRKDLIVADVIYNPRKTKLLLDAQAHGCQTVAGIGMLLWQGAEAFRLYTDCQMPVRDVEQVCFAEPGAKEGLTR